MKKLRLLLLPKDGRVAVYGKTLLVPEGEAPLALWSRYPDRDDYALVGFESKDDFDAARARRPELSGFDLNEWRYRELYPGVWPPVPLESGARPVASTPPSPRKLPELPPEVHHTTAFDAEAAMAAVRALSKGG